MMQKGKISTITDFLETINFYGYTWIVKRLTGNDTGLTGGHQAGMYLPRWYFENVFPEVTTTTTYNPDSYITEIQFPKHKYTAKNVRAIYYNSKFFPERNLKKKYDEFRMTGWGGKKSPVLDPENTGAVCVLAICKRTNTGLCWITGKQKEETVIEKWLGRDEIEPGQFYSPARKVSQLIKIAGTLPEEWFDNFPSGTEIFKRVIELHPTVSWKKSIDELLLKRRNTEFQLFEALECKDILPKIEAGFTNVDMFIQYANSVANRRKSRTGKSLELNLETIFREEQVLFDPQVRTEKRKRPDFIFPSSRAYHDKAFPEKYLGMMAAKTCCKDRWRQVLNEANRVHVKHLFTLQQGVSPNQLEEMNDHNVSLVVPKPNLGSFPAEWRKRIQTLEGFVVEIKKQQQGIPKIRKWTS